MDKERLVDRDLAAVAAVQSRVVIGTGDTHVDILMRVVKTNGSVGFPFLYFPSRADQNVVPIHPDFVTSYTVPAAVDALSISDIEGQIMPGAGNDIPFESSLDKRPPLMGTAIMDGVQLSLDIEQCDRAVIDLDDL